MVISMARLVGGVQVELSDTALHVHRSRANSNRAVSGALRKPSCQTGRFTKRVRIGHSVSITSVGNDFALAAVLTGRPGHEISNPDVASTEGDDRALVKILTYPTTKFGYGEKLTETPKRLSPLQRPIILPNIKRVGDAIHVAGSGVPRRVSRYCSSWRSPSRRHSLRSQVLEEGLILC